LAGLFENLPTGTNFALLQFMRMLVSGSLLTNRGALFPALKSPFNGLPLASVSQPWTGIKGSGGEFKLT
jgi:hypothetical protein